MTAASEKRLLQLTLAVVLILPLTAALAGVMRGPAFLGRPPVVPVALDSHVRYLSGVLLAMLAAYASCIPGVERKGARLRLLVALTVTGGFARLLSLILVGVPPAGHLAGLAIELVVAPVMLAWQMRVARRFERVA